MQGQRSQGSRYFRVHSGPADGVVYSPVGELPAAGVRALAATAFDLGVLDLASSEPCSDPCEYVYVRVGSRHTTLYTPPSALPPPVDRLAREFDELLQLLVPTSGAEDTGTI